MHPDEMIIDSIKKIHSHEEILQALQTIKDVCDDHPRCIGCPFYNDDDPEGCNIVDSNRSPSEWAIKDTEEDWKAFK